MRYDPGKPDMAQIAAALCELTGLLKQLPEMIGHELALALKEPEGVVPALRDVREKLDVIDMTLGAIDTTLFDHLPGDGQP